MVKVVCMVLFCSLSDVGHAAPVEASYSQGKRGRKHHTNQCTFSRTHEEWAKDHHEGSSLDPGQLSSSESSSEYIWIGLSSP